jgi:outer membrane murein-binding lipoprotein Lpp
VQEKPEDMAGTPSLADIAAAMKVLQPEPKRTILESNVSTIIVAGILGLAGWLLMGLNSMQQAVGQMSVTVATMSKQIESIAQDAKAGDGQQTQMKENVARLDQRVTALEGRGNGNRGTAGVVSDRP